VPHIVLSGTIDSEGLAARLREIEETCATGVIAFRDGDVAGEVKIVQGQLAMKQPTRADGRDPVDVMLSMESGTYEVRQQLPALPVSSGDDTKRQGSLEVHVAADLMNYCERAGLTGWLVLASPDGDRAEIGYDRGELTGIRLQGPQELQEVFRWEEGRFEIEAAAVEDAFAAVETADDEDDDEEVDPMEMAKTAEYRALPADPPEKKKRRDDTAQHFLRVVEMTLAQIAEDREQHRPATRTGPPLPPVPETRDSVPAPAGSPAPPTRLRRRRFKKTPTIPIVYIDPTAEGEPSTDGLRHVKRGDMTAEVVLPEAAPERRSTPRASSAPPPAKNPERKRPEKKMSEAKSTPAPAATPKADEPKLPAAVWAVIAMLVVLGALVVLATLPRVH
tara:strand:- start:3497 stop:4669 length:1173 start_codon:yes stop_codon:yes gene_type:complete